MSGLFFVIERFVEKNLLPFGCSVLGIFKKKKSLLAENKRLLVIRLWALGEAILILPMLKTLKNTKPDSEITVLCTKKTSDVFYMQKFIDQTEIVSSLSSFKFILKNLWKYDLVIDTEPHFAISAIVAFFTGKRSIGYNHLSRAKLYDINVKYNAGQHAVFTICDLLKPLEIIAQPDSLVSLNYSTDAKSIVDARFAAVGIDPSNPRNLIIGMHAFCGPTASWRVWPKERFAKLADLIRKKYKNSIIIFTGSKSESAGIQDIISSMDSRERVFDFSDLPSSSLFYLISKYSLMVSNDTGPMHVAAAQGVPTIGFFGPNLPTRFGPFPPKKHIALHYPLNCTPCINVHLGEFRKCENNGECMKGITVDDAIAAVDALLKG
ncbi:glycosyltransferase family 9 protein [Candidatus Micrarchaeota archaeon]|nr:glycosyltransferase family 9 protein [Candidatus Micrarchaeota archaeon]MBU1165987.1 glycosyltransferase family 9 protein [Candidatus Micrarchaeota archaeon]MBU1886436.1 glycosyltransferase family 9 protein [Candidatus Micrarchaeota archaeon]